MPGGSKGKDLRPVGGPFGALASLGRRRALLARAIGIDREVSLHPVRAPAVEQGQTCWDFGRIRGYLRRPGRTVPPGEGIGWAVIRSWQAATDKVSSSAIVARFRGGHGLCLQRSVEEESDFGPVVPLTKRLEW